MILMIKCLLSFCEENKNAEEVLGSNFFYYFCRKVYRIMNYMSNTHIVCIDEGKFFFNRFVAERKRCFRPTAILMIRYLLK